MKPTRGAHGSNGTVLPPKEARASIPMHRGLPCVPLHVLCQLGMTAFSKILSSGNVSHPRDERPYTLHDLTLRPLLALSAVPRVSVGAGIVLLYNDYLGHCFQDQK